MTKRIIALLTALLMVFSAFLLAGCDKTTGDGEGDPDPTGKNLSAKELFKVSLVNTVLGDNADILSARNNSAKSIKGTLSAEVNALEIEGASVLPENKPIKATFNIEADLEKQAAKLGLVAELLGEKPGAEVIFADNTLYITDVLGLNDKAIKIALDDVLGTGAMDSATDGMADSAVAVTPAWMEKLPELADVAVKALEAAITANITDSAFAEETKDVTVGGKEFKGVRVITLTITSDNAKGLVKDFLNKILENKDIADMLGGEINVDEIVNEVGENFGSVKVVNTTYNKDTIALDVLVSSTEAPLFKVEGTFVDDNCSLKMAPTTKEGALDEAQGILYFDRTVENGNEKIALGFKEDGEEIKFLTFEGTYANGKHDGTLKIDMDGQEIAIKLSLETGKGKFKLAISEISVAGQALKFDLVIDTTFSSTKESVTVSFKNDNNLMGLGKIDVKLSIAAEITNVNITAPSNSISFEELDENTLMGWLSNLGNKYPKIMQFINDAMNQQKDFNDTVALPDDNF